MTRTRSFRTVIVVVMTLAVSLITVAFVDTSPASAQVLWRGILDPGVNFRTTVVNQASQECLVAWQSPNGNPVWLGGCGTYDGWNVQWELEWVNSTAFQLRKPGTNQCLVAPPWTGDRAILYTCGHADQWWTPEDYASAVYGLRNWARPDRCLVGPSWSNDRAVSWSCNRDYADQRWSFLFFR